jgi:hypothetical protein
MSHSIISIPFLEYLILSFINGCDFLILLQTNKHFYTYMEWYIKKMPYFPLQWGADEEEEFGCQYKILNIDINNDRLSLGDFKLAVNYYIKKRKPYFHDSCHPLKCRRCIYNIIYEGLSSIMNMDTLKKVDCGCILNKFHNIHYCKRKQELTEKHSIDTFNFKGGSGRLKMVGDELHNYNCFGKLVRITTDIENIYKYVSDYGALLCSLGYNITIDDSPSVPVCCSKMRSFFGYHFIRK